MEARFGYSFGGVRIHQGPLASAAAAAVNAAAFTVGQDIVLADSFYRPGTKQGNFLLAHELAHTIQQGPADDREVTALTHAHEASETEADQVAATIASAPGAQVRGTPVVERTRPILARIDCTKLPYRSCRTGVHKCGWGNSGTCAWLGPTRGCVCSGQLGPKDLIIALAALFIIAAVIASIPEDIIVGIGLGLAAVARWLALLLGLTIGAGATAAEPDEEKEPPKEKKKIPAKPLPAQPAPVHPPAQPPPHALPNVSLAEPPQQGAMSNGQPPLQKKSGGQHYRFSVVEELNLEKVSVGKAYGITFDPMGPKQRFVVLQVTNRTGSGGETTVDFVSLMECSRAEKTCDTGGNSYTVTHPHRVSLGGAEGGRVVSKT